MKRFNLCFEAIHVQYNNKKKIAKSYAIHLIGRIPAMHNKKLKCSKCTGGRLNEILRGQVFIIDEKFLGHVIITLKK